MNTKVIVLCTMWAAVGTGFGGPFGGPEGSGRSWEGVWGAHGGSGGVLGGLGTEYFLFVGSDFVNDLAKYRCFQFGNGLLSGRWSLFYSTFSWLFEACVLRNSEVNMF